MNFKKLLRLPYLPLLLAPIVLLSPLLFGGKVLFWGTPGLQFIPWWTAAWKTLLSGHMPLWNPLLGMGAPLLANYQSALFYPPTWIYLICYALGGIAAMAWAQGLLLCLHLIWAGLGMAKLTQNLGWGRLAQSVAGLAYALSGYLVARAWFASINAATAWLPWILLTAYCAVRQPSLRRWALLSLAIGLQLLAGHAQITWYSLIFTGLWILFWASQRGTKGMRWKTLFTATWGYLLAGIGGIALAAIQLLSTAEYLLQSQRSTALDFDFALNYSFWPWRFITMLAPDFFGSPVRGDFWGYGNYWEDAVYIGLLPLLLALSVLFQRKNTDRRQPSFIHSPASAALFGGILTLLSFLLALGKNIPIFPWLYRHIPSFDMFQAPTRLSLWAVVSLSMLAALGADMWHRPQGRGLYWTRLATAGAFAVSLGAGIAYLGMGDVSPTFIRALALAGLWGLGAGVLSLTAPPHAKKSNTHFWKWAVVLWIAADLLVAGWGLNPGVESDFYTQAALTGDQLQGGRIYLPLALEDELKYGRFLRFDTFDSGGNWRDMRLAAIPNLNILDDIPTVNNFDPFTPGRYARWMNTLEDLDARSREPILDLMAVSWVGQANAGIGPGVDFVPRGGANRFRWVPCASPAMSAEAAWEQAFSGKVNFERRVILEGGEAASSRVCDPALGQVMLEDEHPNALQFSTKSDTPGWLLVADVWYPGWMAWVDGSRVEVYRANYLFRAIELPAGTHTVVFAYRPLSFLAGVLISILAWAGIGFVILRRRRVRPKDSTQNRV